MGKFYGEVLWGIGQDKAHPTLGTPFSAWAPRLKPRGGRGGEEGLSSINPWPQGGRTSTRLRGYLEMRLKPFVCLDLSNFTTFAESLTSQGFQVTFQMSSEARRRDGLGVDGRERSPRLRG